MLVKIACNFFNKKGFFWNRILQCLDLDKYNINFRKNSQESIYAVLKITFNQIIKNSFNLVISCTQSAMVKKSGSNFHTVWRNNTQNVR